MRINNFTPVNYIQSFKGHKADDRLIEEQIDEIKTPHEKGKYPCAQYFTPNLSTANKETYFIRMHEYGKNSMWAEAMMKADEKITNAIKKEGVNFSDIVNMAIEGVRDSYGKENWFTARGVDYKTQQTPYCIEDKYSRGGEYLEKYLEKIPSYNAMEPIANKEYKDANVCRFARYADGNAVMITEGWDYNNEISNLDLAAKEYQKLRSIEDPTEDEINRSVATIHWLIAQESPFQRGSDSIANLITKSIYHAYDMETSPIIKGHSFDFEAWGSDLEDFIEIYPELFETRPHKINN